MFNKETEYALRGLVYIQMQNTDGKRPGIAEISEQIDAPYFYTAKILQRLVRQGFVKSQKGKGGGFYLIVNSLILS
ncbi:MAG: Rrf2 family transcriptional regulator [Bacteroidales bacterium]|nr:Rrf2 family transcriptional regulator [Bacteroidales bacterium]